MDIVLYDPSQHKEQLENLLKLRGLPTWHSKYLPRIAFAAIKDNKMVALCSLRTVEGPYAFIDDWITNPEASSNDRSDAVESGINTVVGAAKALGIKKLFAFSPQKSGIDRLSNKFGFEETTQYYCEKWME